MNQLLMHHRLAFCFANSKNKNVVEFGYVTDSLGEIDDDIEVKTN